MENENPNNSTSSISPSQLKKLNGEESRWQRNRTGRSLSGAQKSSPLSSKGGRTKILKIKKGTQENQGRRPVPGRESQ